jgi:cytochrome c553
MRAVLVRAVLVGVVMLAGGGCRRDMQDAPRYDPYEASTFFKDGRASRHLVAGTVARGQLHEDTAFYTGKSPDGYVSALPFPLTHAVLDRGHERYDIYCSPCHDRAGTGAGMIVQRGYKPPPSLHEDRLRRVPLGYVFGVMTNGFGAMPGYAPQVPADDRWAIAAYVRALQLSQHASVDDVPPADRGALDAPSPEEAHGAS